MIKFIINYITLLFSNSIVYIIDLITNTYITRKIGTTVLGSYSLMMNIFSFLISLSLFGIPLSITKIVSEKTVTDRKSISSYCKTAIKICTITSIFSIIITYIFKDTVSNIILKDSINSNFFLILAFTLPFISISSCICGYFNAMRKVNKSASYNIIVNIVKGISIVALLYLYNSSYLSLILSLAISEIVGFIYVFASYIKYTKNIDKSDKKVYNKDRKKESYAKDILKICSPIAFTTLIKSGLSTLKHSLIPIQLQKCGFSRDYALSRYGIIHGISLPFILIPSIFVECFSDLILPEYSRLYASSDKRKIDYYTKKSFIITMNFSLYISFLIYISSDLICNSLYNNTEVAYYVKILTPIIWVMYLDCIIDNMLRGLNLQVDVIKINILDAIISIALIYFCVPKLGTFGYILVLYVSEYLNCLISLNLLTKKTGFNFRFVHWLYIPFIILFSSFSICNIIFDNIDSYINLFFYIILFTILYLIFSLIMNIRKSKPNNN